VDGTPEDDDHPGGGKRKQRSGNGASDIRPRQMLEAQRASRSDPQTALRAD
jgi:hypothetical protein